MKVTQKFIYTLNGDNGDSEKIMQNYSKMKFGEVSSINVISAKIYETIKSDLINYCNPKFFVVLKNTPSSSYYLTRSIVKGYAEDNGIKNTAIVRGTREFDNLRGFSNVHYKKRAKFKTSFINIAESYLNGMSRDDDIVIIDDAYVAGTFTKLVTDRLAELGFRNLHFVYYIKLHPELLMREPFFEHKLNTYSVSDLSALSSYLNRGRLLPTRKFIKLILSSSDEQILQFLGSLNEEGIQFIHRALRTISSNDLDNYYLKRFIYIKEEILRSLI